mmetsp:Transcript_2649/g.314  ORF Transcript_2649/g.314 Transcript_2649/m.314 type:complete len:98 (-) Transcript_2649:377-670(-)
MHEKFSALDRTFGTNGGGCDICSANMKYLWCIFTCDPNQEKWVTPGETITIPDPIHPLDQITVLKLNYTVSDNLACSLYQSCKKCSYVTEVSAMQSS